MPTTSTFVETQFPTDISYGSSGGSGFSTTIFSTEGGWEQRNVNWSATRAEYDVSHGIKSRADMDVIIEFFMAMRGRAYAFRFKDWSDFYIVNQQIGVGDGTTRVFQLVKTYTDPLGLSSYTRTIVKPVSGSLTTLLVSGVPVVSSAFSVNYTTGGITFNTAPAATHPIIVSYIEFDTPCRFDTDKLNVRQDFWETESWEGIKLMEVRL